MNDVWSFIGIIALWIGISVGLWWLHRYRIRRRQNRQIEHAERATAYLSEAHAVFDKIRSPVPLDHPPADRNDWLRTETHALLMRIQTEGPYFDKVNVLRTELQALLTIEEHEALSEILNLRRDLWAASEIILVEDPSSFGPAFAEEGSYERIQPEAVRLLFKRENASDGDEDIITLRLSLAEKAAKDFANELKATIEAARERDRLPTVSEIIAYPIAFFRGIPRTIGTGYRFICAFAGHAMDVARTIRESETIVHSANRLRQAREDWPQRLSTGYEQASAAARDSAQAIRRHYDVLVAAYDFQSKYQQALQRAPEITERGRQFITRLELAERSEHLRLTSTNAAIWIARRLVQYSGNLIAAIQRLYATLRETTPWNLTAALIAPEPSTGRRTSSFRSFQMALAYNGLNEERAEPRQSEAETVKKSKKKAKSSAKFKAKPKAPKGKTAKAKTAKKHVSKTTPTAASPAKKKSASKNKPPAADKPAPIAASASEKTKSAGGSNRANAKTARKTEIPREVNSNERMPLTSGVVGEPAAVEIDKKAAAPKRNEKPETVADANLRDRRPSLFSRFFSRIKRQPKTNGAVSFELTEEQAAFLSEAASSPDTAAGIPLEEASRSTLMDKLSNVGENASEIAEEEKGKDSSHEDETEDATLVPADEAESPGPLTLSIMDLQAKIKPKDSQIRSFPWLRG